MSTFVCNNNKSSAVAEMGDRGHSRHEPKRELLFLFRGDLGPRLIQCGLGRGLLPYQVWSSSIQPFGHNKNGPKIGGSAPFLGRGAGSPSSTMWPGPHGRLQQAWQWGPCPGRVPPVISCMIMGCPHNSQCNRLRGYSAYITNYDVAL